MAKTTSQLDTEIAEALASRRAGVRPLYWDQRYAKAGDLAVGDTVLLGSVPPYTAYEVIRIEPAPRRRVRLLLARLPDREHPRESLLRSMDTVAVPIEDPHG